MPRFALLTVTLQIVSSSLSLSEVALSTINAICEKTIQTKNQLKSNHLQLSLSPKLQNRETAITVKTIENEQGLCQDTKSNKNSFPKFTEKITRKISQKRSEYIGTDNSPLIIGRERERDELVNTPKVQNTLTAYKTRTHTHTNTHTHTLIHTHISRVHLESKCFHDFFCKIA